MNEVIDPVTGLPMPAPATPPINVGMPGSTPIPANVAHNVQQPVQTGQRMLNPIAPTVRKGETVSRQEDAPKEEPKPKPEKKPVRMGYVPKTPGARFDPEPITE